MIYEQTTLSLSDERFLRTYIDKQTATFNKALVFMRCMLFILSAIFIAISVWHFMADRQLTGVFFGFGVLIIISGYRTGRPMLEQIKPAAFDAQYAKEVTGRYHFYEPVDHPDRLGHYIDDDQINMSENLRNAANLRNDSQVTVRLYLLNKGREDGHAMSLFNHHVVFQVNNVRLQDVQ